MFSIKICGVTQPDDAAHAITAGADAIGLNFYSSSPRSVSQMKAREIVAAARSAKLSSEAKFVGVFVNESPAQLRSIADAVGLDAIQLHGDESPQDVAALAPLPVIRAFRMKPNDEVSIIEYVIACLADHPLEAVLIDAAVPGQFGGTGEKADWHQVAQLQQRILNQLQKLDAPIPQLVLAGGLVPDNVADAILAANPDAVDTASGVESSPGEKDAQLVTEFVSNAKRALATRKK